MSPSLLPFCIVFKKKEKKSLVKTFLSYEKPPEGGRSLSANTELPAAAPVSSACHVWRWSFPWAAISVQHKALILHLHAEARCWWLCEGKPSPGLPWERWFIHPVHSHQLSQRPFPANSTHSARGLSEPLPASLLAHNKPWQPATIEHFFFPFLMCR